MKTKKIWIVSLTAILILTSIVIATLLIIKGNKGSVKVEDPINPITPVLSPWEETIESIHEFSVIQGSKDFIVNGSTEYVIVIPENPENMETTYGATELKYFLGQATGVDIQIISDKDLVYDDTKKYVSLGDTNLIASAGITVDKDRLTRSGFRILTKGNSVFLIGGGDFGTLYAAYEFLTQEIGLEVYSDDEIQFNISPSLKLHEFDITDVPDFTYRMSASGFQRFNEVAGRRMRVNYEPTSAKVWMGPQSGWIWHNSFGYISPETWADSHPKWFSDDLEQLCFTAHGDEEEYELFFEEFMRVFIETVNAYPETQNITITQQDINLWCTCDACSAEYEKYGTDSAVIIKFCNKVSDALKDYFKKNNIERTVNICFFAYHKTEDAPVKKDASGNYVPIDEEVICRDNVYCFYAPINADYLRSFYHINNSQYKETMDKWCVISKQMYLWVYSTRFTNYFAPYNSLNQMQENYILAKAHGVNYIFDQMQFNNGASSDWAHLKTYLQSKLQWNVKADKQKLIDDFMNNYYKDAAEPMKKALALYNTYFEYLKTEKNIPGGCFSDLLTPDNFPKGIIDTMLGYFEEAYEAIESLKNSNPKLYQQLYDRICLESLTYRYLDISMYSTYYTNEELLALKEQFKEDAIRIGVTNWYELGTIDLLWNDWGL